MAVFLVTPKNKEIIESEGKNVVQMNLEMGPFSYSSLLEISCLFSVRYQLNVRKIEDTFAICSQTEKYL